MFKYTLKPNTRYARLPCVYLPMFIVYCFNLITRCNVRCSSGGFTMMKNEFRSDVHSIHGILYYIKIIMFETTRTQKKKQRRNLMKVQFSRWNDNYWQKAERKKFKKNKRKQINWKQLIKCEIGGKKNFTLLYRTKYM